MDFPFTTDQCSLFPNGTWGGCCVDHDKVYWRGGSKAEKLEADLALMACVARKGYPVIAAIMFLGVLVGGLPYWPLPWRWGYGWRYAKALTFTSQVELLAHPERPDYGLFRPDGGYN